MSIYTYRSPFFDSFLFGLLNMPPVAPVINLAVVRMGKVARVVGLIDA